MPITTTGAGGYPAISGGAFTPASLTGLIVWLDASVSASVIRAGANVSAWNDQSGAGNNFTAFNNPQYSATSWTGSRPGITFNNASSRYLTASLSLTTTTLSVFVVSRSTTSVQFGGIVSILGNGAGGDFNAASSLAFSTDASNVQYLATRNSGNFAASGAGNTDATGGVTFDATNGRSYLNFSLTGGPTGSTGTFGGGTTSIAVGARQTPAIGTYFDGQMAEVIITTSAITGSDLTNLHSYLTTKWGVP